MPAYALYAADVMAILVLVFLLYFPRHHRRDLVVAYLGVNIGVLAVSATLEGATVGAGLGLGLFGVLSIIRLRSTELSQTEVAYYFAALALGLLGGMGESVPIIAVAGMAVVVLLLTIADHPRVLGTYRRRFIVLDRAIEDEEELSRHLGELLRAKIHGVDVQRLDLVNDTTWVDVRFQLHRQHGRKTENHHQAPDSRTSAHATPDAIEYQPVESQRAVEYRPPLPAQSARPHTTPQVDLYYDPARPETHPVQVRQ